MTEQYQHLPEAPRLAPRMRDAIKHAGTDIDTLDEAALLHYGEIGDRVVEADDDVQTAAYIVSARYQFFDALQWTNVGHDLFDAFNAMQRANNELARPSQVLSSLQGFYDVGIDATKPIARDWRCAIVGKQRIATRYEQLQKDTGRPKLIIEQAGRVLLFSNTAYELNVLLHRSQAVDVARLYGEHPQAAEMRDSELRLRYDVAANYGLKASKVVTQVGQFLTAPLPRIFNQLESLKEVGVDVAKVINRAPIVMLISPEDMQSTKQTLDSFGVDSIRVLEQEPILFIRRDRIAKKVAYITRVLEMYGWQGSIQELLSRNPKLFTTSHSHIGASASLFAQAVDAETFATTPRSTMGSMLQLQPESHLLASLDTQEQGTYTSRASKIEKSPIAQKRGLVDQYMAEKTITTETVGAAGLRAYIRHRKRLQK